MLPTKGYFQDIECPFYNTTCGRPYCHFRHKRKPNENVDENVQAASKNVVPTYKPTPKSELANIHNNKSHIPISYVPDLAFKRERTIRPVRIDKPTYKPTPLSILSSATKPTSSLAENHEDQETIKDIQENIASNIYDPLKSEINFEDLSNEFELIDDIINDTEESPQPSINDNLIKLENDIEKEQNRLNLLKSEINSNEDTDLSTSKVVIKTEICSDEEDLSKVTIRAKFSSDEEAAKDQVVVKKEKDVLKIKKEKDVLNIKKEKSDEKSSGKDKDSKKESRDHKDKKESKTSERDKPKNSDKTKNKDSSSSKEKSSKEKDSKKSEKSSKSHKSSSEREKHRKEEKKNSSVDRESSKDKHKTKTKSKDRSKSPKEKKNDKKHSSKNKSESNSDSEYNSSDRSPGRHRKEKKSDSTKTKKHKSREKSRSRSKKRDKKSKSSKSRSRSRSTSKEKSSKSKHKSKKRSESRTRHKDKDSRNSKSRDDKEKNRSKDKYKEKEKIKPSSKSKKSEEDKKDKREKATSESNHSTSDNDNDVVMIPEDHFIDTVDLIPSDVDLDLDDEDETMRECYKIFNEYKPEPIKRLPPRVEEVEKKDLFEQGSNIYHGKKRTAHAGAENLPAPTKLPSAAPPKPIILPGQTLANRYRIAKMTQASNEQENIMNEIKNITQQAVKRPATSLLEAARQHKMKRLQQQKLAEKDKPNVNIVDDILNGVHRPTATQVKALPKKIAAVPNVALIEKAKQRISLVKQQRIENIKTTAHTQKKGRVAHVPEYSLSDIPDVLQADKSKLPVNVRTRFLTMIADECAKLYMLKEDAFNRALNEEFSCYEKCKVLATYRNSAMLAVNRLRKEIQDRESKGLGLLLSGESPVNKKETDFEGKTFYDHVKKWILNEEELDVHGYPRETDERGKAIINNREQIDYSIVDENHRKCCRCGKIYQVDDDGWPLFEEECMYHPMKKRTIRGEQIFLCCKSNDDTGCATSDTHVFDGLPKHLLEGYQTTLPPESDDDIRSIQVYALDCEMCYTTKGLELTRVTIVDTDCKTIYESFVKPLNPIIDYNTRFSGITKDQMDRTSTSILQVQANILHLCNSETILVGHSLESDMKALKIVHGTIIDTSVLFPHRMGLPHKRALRALASEYLKKIIQNDVAGHDSAEDAVACMDLIKWKLKEELKVKVK